VFTDLAATVRRGEHLVVAGPSGSGKSTLLAVLLRSLDPVAGRVLLGGIDARGVRPTLVRRRIAWCPQEAHLFDSTLRGNLLLARPGADVPTDEELLGVLRGVGLGPLLQELPAGLDTPVGPAGGFLSGGQRQRVAVARTLLCGADVLLLDEPTAHLDRQTADALLADVRRAAEDRVLVTVTHDVELLGTGDRAVLLTGAAAPLPA
jgi:ATP-binding cassette subfamily C protein CydCD